MSLGELTETLKGFIGSKAYFIGLDERSIFREQDIGVLESVDNYVVFRRSFGGTISYPIKTIEISKENAETVKKRGRRISISVRKGFVEIE